ncbi:MAG TPA: hypothetical protein VF162_03735 [Streptosporangiaceae bacterium]
MARWPGTRQTARLSKRWRQLAGAERENGKATEVRTQSSDPAAANFWA